MFRKIKLLFGISILIISFFNFFQPVVVNAEGENRIFLENLPGMEKLESETGKAFETDANGNLKNEDGISNVLKTYIN
jgi:hypothetical protein